MLATVTVVAIQNCSRYTSAPTRYEVSADISEVTPERVDVATLCWYASIRKPLTTAKPNITGKICPPERWDVA